jgi:peptidylprolyl isomerase
LKAGSGQSSPEYGTPVTVHYTGSRLNGLVFDSSYQREQAATFEIGRVIQGWNEALVTMKRGEKRILIVPPELAYGDRGYPGVIPPNEYLIFEVELLAF